MDDPVIREQGENWNTYEEKNMSDVIHQKAEGSLQLRVAF
jgi:hypothetical protein